MTNLSNLTLNFLACAGLLGALALPGCGEKVGSSKNAANPQSVDELNSLLRGELSAVETYKQAIVKEASQAPALLRMRDAHQAAVTQLAARVGALGGKPAVASGAWGAFATAVEGTAKIFGNDAAMKALKLGEDEGTRAYESALKDDDLDADSKALVRETLLPRQREHAAELQRLIDAPSPAGGSAVQR